jgi:hypothetical protein
VIGAAALFVIIRRKRAGAETMSTDHAGLSPAEEARLAQILKRKDG